MASVGRVGAFISVDINLFESSRIADAANDLRPSELYEAGFRVAEEVQLGNGIIGIIDTALGGRTSFADEKEEDADGPIAVIAVTSDASDSHDDFDKLHWTRVGSFDAWL